ncbi:MAG: cytochrome P450 [Dehalococcoidia bacterium]
MTNTSPFAAGVKECPYPAYDEWRAESPVLWNDAIDAWLVTGYEEVRHVLMTHQDFSSMNSVFGGATVEHPEFPSIITVDEPRHRKLRALVAKAFTPKTIDALWEPRICELIDEMLDAVCEKDEFDVVADVAYPLPVKMIAEIVGIDSEHFEYFKERSDATVGNLGRLPYPAPEAEDAHQHEPRDEGIQPLSAYFLEQIEDRRANPRDDLITRLVEAEVEREQLDDVEVTAFLILLLIAGNETTTNLITQAVRGFVEHPELIARVHDDPELMEKLIEEALRWEAPIQGFYRRANRDLELGGVSVAGGDALLVLYGAANRDEAKYDCPADFDPDRGDRDHLAFGAGIHVCLGASLARLEARLALEGIVRRFDSLELVDGFEPRWADTPFFRGMTAYRLRFHERA